MFNAYGINFIVTDDLTFIIERKYMKIAALLTGRGNNTLKDKNILPILGNPLLFYPAHAARISKYVDAWYASSDDSKILDAAALYGYKPIVRPEEFARPDSKHVDAIMHSLEVMKDQDNYEPDILIVLLANNAIIKASWIDACIEMILNDNEVSAAVPVFQEQEHHPYRAKKIDKNGHLVPFVDDIVDKDISTNRQDLTPAYHLGHNFWVLNLKKSVYAADGLPPWKFMGKTVRPFLVEMCFDIHTLEDIRVTERWLVDNYE
jgi:CMP-N-acetylneuraminic acid synthetase